jgi:hypothetical protein
VDVHLLSNAVVRLDRLPANSWPSADHQKQLKSWRSLAALRFSFGGARPDHPLA